MDILKVGVIGLTGVLVALLLKKERSDFSMIISFGVCICIAVFTITKVEALLSFAEKLKSLITIDSQYVAIVLKMIGIAYAAEFTVGICRDAGYRAVAEQIETFAKISILVVSMPVLTAFLETLEQFL